MGRQEFGCDHESQPRAVRVFCCLGAQVHHHHHHHHDGAPSSDSDSDSSVEPEGVLEDPCDACPGDPREFEKVTMDPIYDYVRGLQVRNKWNPNSS